MWEIVAGVICKESSLTTSEYCVLLASVEAALNPEKYLCESCITQYGTSERLMKKTLRKRQAKGCFKEVSRGIRIENILFKKCIGSFAVPINYFVEAFILYEKGVMPEMGSLGEQPNKIIEVFRVIEMRRAEKAKKVK